MKSPMRLSIMACAVMALLSGATARGALLAYEGFDTEDNGTGADGDGSTLPAFLGSGYGWGGDWTFYNYGNGQISSPGLTFGDLPVSGKRAIGEGYVYRHLDQSYTLGAGGGEKPEIWISCLFDWAGLDNRVLALFAWSDDAPLGANMWLNSGTVGQPDDRIYLGGANTAIDVDTNQTVMATLRLTPTGDEDTQVDLYLNYGGDISLSIGEPDYTVTKTMRTFDGIGLRIGASAGSIDEIRIGDTWGDVMMIPEPSTFVLFASALGGLWAYRRRRVRS